jgi:hypothetical protein
MQSLSAPSFMRMPGCERRPRVAHVVFHGNWWELQQHYGEGQGDQLGGLGLIVNAIVLWSTHFMEGMLNRLRRQGLPVRDEGFVRFSLAYRRFAIDRLIRRGPPEDSMEDSSAR